MPYLSGILPRLSQQLQLHEIDVGENAQAFAIFAFQADELLRINEAELVDVEHLFPLRVDRVIWSGADQPMQAGFKGVIASSPTGRQSAWRPMLLDELNGIAAFPSVDGRAQSGNAGANDDNLPRRPSHVRYQAVEMAQPAPARRASL
jgi:hypothetical protein